MAEQHNQQALAYLAQHQAVSRHQLRQVSEHQAPQEALAQAALEAYLVRRHQLKDSAVSEVHQHQ